MRRKNDTITISVYYIVNDTNEFEKSIENYNNNQFEFIDDKTIIFHSTKNYMLFLTHIEREDKPWFNLLTKISDKSKLHLSYDLSLENLTISFCISNLNNEEMKLII